MKYTIKVIDDSGVKITGEAASTTLKILRLVDEYHYDFDDDTFKDVPTTLTSALTEIDAVNWAGGYSLVIDISGWNNGYYIIEVVFDDGSTIRNYETTIFVKNGINIHESIFNKDFDMLDVGKLGGSSTALTKLKESAETIVNAVKIDTSTFAATLVDFESSLVAVVDPDHYAGRQIIFTDNSSIPKQACRISETIMSNGKVRFIVTRLTRVPLHDDEFNIV